MNYLFMGLALQDVEPDNTSMWIILAAVLVILFLIVVIVGVGLTIFFIARKRKKAQMASAASALDSSYAAGGSAIPGLSQPDVPPTAPSQTPMAESFSPGIGAPSEEPAADSAADFDPTRTVAINREGTVAISFGTIKFVSGVLAGQEFDVNPEGSYIGRESSLAQIIVSDPRISKRHLWIGVRDGVVTIVDQDSRNGTFVNDPKSERVTEARLNSGDTVILGESDVARFEYHA